MICSHQGPGCDWLAVRHWHHVLAKPVPLVFLSVVYDTGAYLADLVCWVLLYYGRSEAIPLLLLIWPGTELVDTFFGEASLIDTILSFGEIQFQLQVRARLKRNILVILKPSILKCTSILFLPRDHNKTYYDLLFLLIRDILNHA